MEDNLRILKWKYLSNHRWDLPESLKLSLGDGNIENCVWTKIPTKLQNDVKDTVAMPIPNALADKLCN